MRFRHNIIIKISIVLILISATMLTPCVPSRAYAAENFSFMDLESSFKELQARIDKVRRSVVLVIVYDSSGLEVSRGSGFFIDKNGTILANASIVENAYSAKVLSRSNSYDTVTILNTREDLDISVLQVDAINETPLLLDFEYKFKPGERVMALGKSSNTTLTITEGLINTTRNLDESSHLIEIETTTTLTLFKPSKDGPLVNVHGNVIGVTTPTITPAERNLISPWAYDSNYINAVSILSIKPALTNYASINKLAPEGSKLWHLWIIRQIKEKASHSFVVLYKLGFNTIIKYAFVVVIFISLILWGYRKLKTKLSS